MEPPRQPGTRRRDRTREEVSAGGIVVRRTAGEPLFLIIRDSYQNWGFPKGHVEDGEAASAAALREVAEETGLAGLQLVGEVDTIDWYFRFRGALIHKVCHFFLLETDQERTTPQRDEGITACRWESFVSAHELVAYDNARAVLRKAHDMLQPGEARSA